MSDGKYHDENCEIDLGLPGCLCTPRLRGDEPKLDMPSNTHADLGTPRRLRGDEPEITSNTHPKESIALKTPPYVAMYPALCLAARRCGYALAVHGSVARDMDLIAVPWVEGAVSAEALVEELRAACGGWIHAPKAKRDPVTKPHGRIAWTIHMGGALDSAEPAAYLDLSVIPLERAR